uniref:Putative snrna-activating protein complex subunit 1 n=2 Tax=Ixodes ricinus TaxID=34613 RepID=V5HIK4_IXORI
MSRVKKVIAGFYTDMNMLLGKFMAKNTVRFVDFAEQWREHKFSLIFSGRKDPRELRYMIEEMMPIILKLWIPTSTFPEKLFALYMLYAFYEVQPIEPKLKVRVKLSHWNMMEEILQQSKKEQHLDVCYIIHRMRVTYCFHFVAYLKHRSPARLTELEDDISSTAEATAKVFADMERLVKDGLLEQLSIMHNQYTSMKAAQEHPGVRQLDMVKENIFDEMNREVSVAAGESNESGAGRTEQAKTRQSGGEQLRGRGRPPDVGARRKRLRERQFANKPNTRQGTRFEELMEREGTLQVDTSPGSSSEEWSPPPTAKRPSRKKGKASKKKADSSDAKSEQPAAQDETSRDQPEGPALDSSRARKKVKRPAPEMSSVEKDQPGD